jgi:hypothetical protein
VTFWLTCVAVAALLTAAHETGHALAAALSGGRVQGLRRRGLAVGVLLDLTGLSPRARRFTVWAGCGAEGLLALAAAALAAAGAAPALWAWATGLCAAFDAAVNLVPWPWWPLNDGHRLRTVA